MKHEFYDELIIRTVELMQEFNELLNENDQPLFRRSTVDLQLAKDYMQSIFEFFVKINFVGIKDYLHQIEWATTASIAYNTTTQTVTHNQIDRKLQHLLPFIDADTIQHFPAGKRSHSYTLFHTEASDASKGFHHLLYWVKQVDDVNYHIQVFAIQVHTTQSTKQKKFYNLSKRELIKQGNRRTYPNYYLLDKGYKFYFNSSAYTYHLHRQMIKAFECITLTNLNLKQVAAEAAYSNYVNMHRTFKRYNLNLAEFNRLLF